MDQKDIWVNNVEAVVSEYVLYPGCRSRRDNKGRADAGELKEWKGENKAMYGRIKRDTHEQERKQREGKKKHALWIVLDKCNAKNDLEMKQYEPQRNEIGRGEKIMGEMPKKNRRNLMIVKWGCI